MTGLLWGEAYSYIYLSDQGLKHYLPAYMHYCIRKYAEADSIPDGLVFIMRLPTEVDILLSALRRKTSPFRAHLNPTAAESDYNRFQNRLQNLNQSVHLFIHSWHQFSPAQSRAILHFLEHVRDEHSRDDNRPSIAIERYWFQFA